MISFEGVLLTSMLSMDLRDLRGATFLRIHYLFAGIILKASQKSGRRAFQAYKHNSEKMVSLSALLIDGSDWLEANSRRECSGDFKDDGRMCNDNDGCRVEGSTI